MIMEVNVYPLVNNGYVAAAVKKVKIFGVPVYKKTIETPPRDSVIQWQVEFHSSLI
jgi:uncharacterized protein YqgV (UPF0045/DUF77 family)